MENIETTNTNVELHERGLTLTTDDGAHLGARIFEPLGTPRGSVLMIGAVATPQRFYARFARSLARDGYRVLTFDYRGVGASRPESLRGFSARLTDWAEHDYPAALDWLVAHHADRPLYAVGHSLGGQVVALAPQAHRLTAFASVAGQSGYYGHFENKTRMAVTWRALVPSVAATFGYVPGWTGTGEDLPSGVALEWARWCLSPDYFLSTHPHYAEPIAAFAKPMRAYTFTDDDYAPLVNVRWLHARYQSARIEHRHLDPRELGLMHVGHFGFFRAETSALWPEASAFFADPETKAPDLLAPSARAWLTDRDLRADLEFGRS